MKRYVKTLIIAIASVTLLLTAGCAAKTQDTKGPVKNQTGMIDVTKAARQHPKYGQLERLRQEYETLAQQYDQQIAGLRPNSDRASLPSVDSGLHSALEEEFNARMADKKAEMDKRLGVKADQIRKELSAELQRYADEVDKEYQPQIFSLQLKLKTVQLSQEETASLQQQLDALQSGRAAKIADKEKALAGQMNERMAPEQAAAEKELAAYAQNINSELAKRAQAAASQPAEAAAEAKAVQSGKEMEEKMNQKRQEIAAVEDFITKDIQDKAAKVAVDRGLTEVLANVRINISAVDITEAVIAEFKK